MLRKLCKVAELGYYALEIRIGCEVACPIGVLYFLSLVCILVIFPKVIFHYIIFYVVFESVSFDTFHVVLDRTKFELILVRFRVS